MATVRLGSGDAWDTTVGCYMMSCTTPAMTSAVTCISVDMTLVPSVVSGSHGSKPTIQYGSTSSTAH